MASWLPLPMRCCSTDMSAGARRSCAVFASAHECASVLTEFILTSSSMYTNTGINDIKEIETPLYTTCMHIQVSQTVRVQVQTCINASMNHRHVAKNSYLYGETRRKIYHTSLEKWHAMYMSRPTHEATTWRTVAYTANECPTVGLLWVYSAPFGRCPVISPNVNSLNVISSNINSPILLIMIGEMTFGECT